MALLKDWHKIAYDEKKDKGTLQRFWANYFNLEKGVYEKLLSEDVYKRQVLHWKEFIRQKWYRERP